MIYNDTICAIATPQGVGALGIIRISGEKAIEISNILFTTKDLTQVPSHTIHYGFIKENGVIIDEVMVAVFKAPKTFTTEDLVEITCHGSSYIIQNILSALINNGCRLAQPGEFTQRAFLGGRIDLSQAEAVADLIAAENKASHDIAMSQMRGGFSTQLQSLRDELINFSALIELELDFSEEDVAFANREDLNNLITELIAQISTLKNSFQYGNVLKEGVPVAIAGKPNAGKSSLLNALFNEEKAIVSSIAGTTRDTIEDTLVINGIKYRFIDTAGLRETTDEIEKIGVEKAREKVAQAKILLYLYDRMDTNIQEITTDLQSFMRDDLILIVVENKIDQNKDNKTNNFTEELNKYIDNQNKPATFIKISTKDNQSIETIKNTLENEINKMATDSNIIISNARHYTALSDSLSALSSVYDGLNNELTGDLLAFHIREAILHLGTITGEVEVDRDILGTIFGKFCIGK